MTNELCINGFSVITEREEENVNGGMAPAAVYALGFAMGVCPAAALAICAGAVAVGVGIAVYEHHSSSHSNSGSNSNPSSSPIGGGDYVII